MKKSLKKRALSIFLAVLIAVSGIIPAANAFAGNGVEGHYELQIFYDETGTMVPTYGDDGESDYIEYMHEGETIQFTYRLIDTEWPDNGYVKWFSENPVLVDTDQTGKVKAFDASKGAVIQSWIDNEVKTIPLAGPIMGKILEKVFFNEYIDLDSMDTEEIVDLLIAAFGSDSILGKYVDAYQGQLVDSLRRYLDNINSNIHCQLYSAEGELLWDDVVRITVLKNEEWYANFLPNGTHITNKSQINTTQAVGNSVQLYAITTPQRLGFGTVYSVKSSSIFDSGKVVATVNDSGLVTFKNTGTVTILVSPDSEQVIEKILELVNYIYKLENTGTLDTDKIAGILIDYVGIDMNRTVLAAILDVCFAIKDIAGDAADPVQLTATAVEIIANLVLQMVYNDTITFNVEEAQPLTNFDIEGATSLREGTQIQLGITNIQPSTGDTSDITWSSSDPTIASVDPKTGVITGLDAGKSLRSQQCQITATSAANNVSKTVTITVTGRAGQYISAAEIKGPSVLETGTSTDLTYAIYPKRVAESDRLYTAWGMLKGEDEDGNPVYEWTSEGNPVSDVAGTIDAGGHYTALDGGTCTVAFKATTGYYLSNGNFYEISSYIATKEISTGIPIDSISINVTDKTGGQLNKITRNETVTINGKDYQYVTIHAGGTYGGAGAVIDAEVYPANATNKKLNWVVDNGYYNEETSNETHTLTVTQKHAHQNADTFNVYAVSEDGEVASNVITVCVTKNYVTSNVIDQNTYEVINGSSIDATHTMSFNSSSDGTYFGCYKCNWYSSDESIFSVETKTNDNRDAKIYGNDVGVATLYCVSADGGYIAEAKVVVKPDKSYLKNIVELCESTVIIRTTENKKLYQTYMRKLDLAYSVLYDQDMASQTTCDTYAQELLTAFYKLGGFVSIGSVKILGTNKTELKGDYITVPVGAVSSYKNYSYDFDYEINPKNAMYKDIEWTSSNDSISVDKNGRCRPTSNDPCSAVITCTVTDYMDNKVSDSITIAFARTPATGVKLDVSSIEGGKVDTTQTLVATVLPTNSLGSSTASCKDVIWSSSDESVATVDSKGVVTFHYGGDCEITCTTMDGGYTVVCPVNVVTNYDKLQLLINQYNDLQLNEINYYPDTWEVFTAAMDESNAMIARGGYSQKEVDAMYATLEQAYKSLQKYNYIQKIELYLDGEATNEFYQYDLRFLKEGISYKNAVLDLNVRLYPNNGSYDTVKWESSTSDISVTTDGKCSPTVESSCYGMITCTVTDHYGSEFKDSVWVSFAYTPVTELTLSDTNLSGEVGETHQLKCTVHPTGSEYLHIFAASIQDYYWESDNENVATVDENGLVTFVEAGSTIIRAVSYDGGISAECRVSTQGDRSALKEALEKYQDVDYTQYDYDYGQRFIRAYNEANDALVNAALTQAQIDEAAANLNKAGEELLAHPYISVETIDINYNTYKKPLIGKESNVASGTIGSNDALSVNLSSGYEKNNTRNYAVINATALPSTSMYKELSWSVDNSDNMDVSVTNASVKLTPKKDSVAWAYLTVTTTDHYSRTKSRTITVVMADNTCNGISISETEKTLYATVDSYQLNYSVSGSPDCSIVDWTSSDESVAKVNADGAVIPVDKGTATITARTADGGYTASVKITVLTDFSQLAEKVNEYSTLINNVKDSYEYTEDSLNTLSAAVAQCKVIVDENRATQAEVNENLEMLIAAYNALRRYEPVTGLNITCVADQANVTEPNDGFIRYSYQMLNNRSVQLDAGLQPHDGMYKSIEWTSSNDKITVDNYGLVTSTSAESKYALITCTVTNVYDQTFTDSVYVSFVRYGVTAVTFDNEQIFGGPQEIKNASPKLNQGGSGISSSKVDDCLYSSSDESVATVDSEGNITFVSQGSATITVTALDGGFTGTIEAITTWDTGALQEAIAQAKSITYTDYAYAQGTEFKAAYDAAKIVYENVYASQSEIDEACARLQTAMTNLEGNEFVKPEATVFAGEKQISDGGSYAIDNNSNVTLSYALNEGAMTKSVEWQTSDANGFTTAVNGGNLVVTKTVDTPVSLDVTLVVTDDYDRVTTYAYSINIVNQIINITSIDLYVNGSLADATYTETGHGTLYRNFKPIQLSYTANPDGAVTPVSVTWSSNAKSFITVDENGLVDLTTLGKGRSSNTAVIECTVENPDGTKVSKTIEITIAR